MYLVARFIRFYPGLYWAPHWPTRDGVIPYALFYELLRAITNVGAAEQLDAYYAQLLAVGQVMGGDAGRSTIREAITRLTRLGYPTARPEPPARPASRIEVVSR